MTLIVPRIAGITPEQSAFYENISRQFKTDGKNISQLDDLINDTRVSIGLTDERLNAVQDQVDQTGTIVAGATTTLDERVTTIERDYSQFVWNKVLVDVPSISIPSGAYDQEMAGYPLTADKSGWYRYNVAFKAVLSNLGVLYMRCVTPQMVGWCEFYSTSFYWGAAVQSPLTARIDTEFPVVANNGTSIWRSFQFMIRLDAGETVRLFLTKVGTLTLSGTIGPDSAVSLVYVKGY